MEALIVKMIPIDDIEPNPWNPNRMTEVVLEAEYQSIITYGFIDPVTVRPHPADEGKFQIIDGEHRFKTLMRIIETKPAGLPESVSGLIESKMVPAVVLKVNDVDAKKLTVILNETRGRADTALLSELLATLASEITMDELSIALPFGEAELNEMVKIGEFKWDELLGEPVENTEEQAIDDDGEWFSIPVRMPQGALNVYNQARDLIADENKLHKKPDIANGMVIEMLAAEYLAMPKE